VVKRLILTFFLLFHISYAAYSGDALTVTFEPNPVGVRDNSNLVIDLPLDSSAGVDLLLPDLPEGVQLWRGPYIRSYTGQDYADQGHLRFVRVSMTLRSTDPGRKVIPPVLIESETDTFSVGPFLFEVGLYRSGALQVPLEPYWEVESRDVYQGQTVSLLLMVPDRKELLLVDEVRTTAPREGIFEEVEGIGSLRKEVRGGFSFYTIPAAAFLFTPERAASVLIPRGTVRIGEVTDSFEAIQIDVKPVPEAISSTGAVGQFRYEAELSIEEDIERGEFFSVSLQVEGIGNLPYLSIPVPELSGADLLRVEREEQIEADRGGYRGWRRETLHYVVTSSDTIEISYPPFPFLVPESGRVVEKRIGAYQLALQSDTGSARNQDEGSGAFPFALKREWKGSSWVAIDNYVMASNYLWLLPGPLLFLFFLFAGKGRRGTKAAALTLFLFLFISALASQDDRPELSEEERVELWDRAVTAYDEGDFTVSMNLFSLLSELCPDDHLVQYNASLAAWQGEEAGKALWHARKGYRIKPGDESLIDVIDFYERELELAFQIPPPFPVHPDFFFFILLLSCNGAGFFGVFFLLHRRSFSFIMALFLLFTSLAAAFALGISARNHLQPAAVLGKSGGVSLIPEKGSSIAFTLEEGAAVRILGESKGYLFISTGIDTRGWILKENLLPLFEGPLSGGVGDAFR
jgi:hypothetical protein